MRAARRQAGLWGALKQYPRVRRESHRVIRSAANTAMSHARTSCNVSLTIQVRKLRYYNIAFIIRASSRVP
ncbi:MAG: hypothetical protein U9P07_06810 [Pseudomonadota bacterium]|nr:hypothetical protein [Pseudomonadota bacterium]